MTVGIFEDEYYIRCTTKIDFSDKSFYKQLTTRNINFLILENRHFKIFLEPPLVAEHIDGSNLLETAVMYLKHQSPAP